MEKKLYVVDRWGYAIDTLVNTVTDDDGFTVYIGSDGREYPAYGNYYLNDLGGLGESQWNCEVARSLGLDRCQCGLCPDIDDDDDDDDMFWDL